MNNLNAGFWQDDGTCPIVFTDFDGVFHHAFPREDKSDEENARFAYLSFFEDTMRENTSPIVISSTWRLGREIDTLRSVFSPDIAERIVGVTPFIGNGRGNREREILLYLKTTDQEERPWVAVDDVAELFSSGAVVVCDDQFGEREAMLLGEALQNPELFSKNHPVIHSDTIQIIRLSSKP